MDTSGIACVVSANRLRQFAEHAFQQVGCSSKDAIDAANVLMWASLRGVDTHGIRNLLPYYLGPIQAGEIEAQPRIAVSTESPTAARVDGGGGLGLVTANFAMRLAMRKADDIGVGMVTVENSHHLGPAGFFASMCVADGMLGVCTTGHFFGDGNRIGVAPLNAIRPMFSTNPVSFAAPCGQRPTFVLDMSTSVTTVNRIEAMGQAGGKIPTGWAKDKDGNPTIDPDAACVLNSLGGEKQTGGHKGFALSMLVSVLSGVLSGGWKHLTTPTQQKYAQSTMGHFVAAIRIDQFMPVDEFQASMDAMMNAILACPPVDSSEPLCYPGSNGHATEETRLRDGIPIDRRLLEELQHIRDSLSIPVQL